jgi:hypothetical protein
MREAVEGRHSNCRPRLYLAVAAALLLSGCNGLLPESTKLKKSPWTSFAEARSAYDKITPLRSTVADLESLGFDPYKTPNITILSYLDLIERFMPHPTITAGDLDPSVRRCIESRDGCGGYEVKPNSIHTERTGNFISDMFNFRRTTHRSGWSFQALIVLQDDLVVYKIWRGTPIIQEEEHQRNPLGPLQDPGDWVTDTMMP